MAGHSKWANIQHRKGRQDEKRGKIWTRVIREIMVAARSGGGDLNATPRLRLAVDKAKAANMPADTIKRNIDKATGKATYAVVQAEDELAALGMVIGAGWMGARAMTSTAPPQVSPSRRTCRMSSIIFLAASGSQQFRSLVR